MSGKKQMSDKKAFQIALNCMQFKMREYTFGAKRYELMGSRTPSSVSDYEHYTEIEGAIKNLIAHYSQKKLF